jgi:hypothetical protein
VFEIARFWRFFSFDFSFQRAGTGGSLSLKY